VRFKGSKCFLIIGYQIQSTTHRQDALETMIISLSIG